MDSFLSFLSMHAWTLWVGLRIAFERKSATLFLSLLTGIIVTFVTKAGVIALAKAIFHNVTRFFRFMQFMGLLLLGAGLGWYYVYPRLEPHTAFIDGFVTLVKLLFFAPSNSSVAAPPK